MYTGQPLHSESPPAALNRPFPHSRHCRRPSMENFPGGHGPAHIGVVSPDVFPKVPPGHMVQSLKSFEPVSPLKRPAGHESHMRFPLALLYVPGRHASQTAIVVVSGSTPERANVPGGHAADLQLACLGLSWYDTPSSQATHPAPSLLCPSTRPRLPAGQASHWSRDVSFFFKP